MTDPRALERDDHPADAGDWAVVVNHEGQYSVWTLDRPPPDGWDPEGTTGTRQECLDHIDQVWTDLRPLSLRRLMDGESA